MRSTLRTVGSTVLALLPAGAAFAQAPAAPAAPPKAWTETASAGLAVTSGNTDTTTINVGYEVVYDPHLRNLVRSAGLFLHGTSDGDVNADRLALVGRDEYTVTDGLFAYGQAQYLRDRFKDITYLVAPTAGIGYRAIHTNATTLALDAGAGGVWEKNPGADVKTSGAVTFGDKLLHKLSTTATLTQSFSALFKTDDFEDALYVLGAAVAASISSRTQLKFEVVDTFKGRPPDPTLHRNDVAVLMAFVYKN
jgi:putative salt-induced outer membrane protein